MGARTMLQLTVNNCFYGSIATLLWVEQCKGFILMHNMLRDYGC